MQQQVFCPPRLQLVSVKVSKRCDSALHILEVDVGVDIIESTGRILPSQSGSQGQRERQGYGWEYPHGGDDPILICPVERSGPASDKKPPVQEKVQLYCWE